MNYVSTRQELRSSRDVTGPVAPPRARLADDKAMLRAAADLTRDLNVPRATIYWADLGLSALVEAHFPRGSDYTDTNELPDEPHLL